MKVVAVYEDNHGMIAIVKNYQAGVRYLLNNEWIDDTTEMQDEDNRYHMITDFLGADWRQQMFSWGIDKFNTLMDGQFCMMEVDVYE